MCVKRSECVLSSSSNAAISTINVTARITVTSEREKAVQSM